MVHISIRKSQNTNLLWIVLLFRANAKAGETVLVHGASGGVGLAACQIASALKLNVIGTAGTDKGVELVKRNGASLVLNHRHPNHTQNLKVLKFVHLYS